MINISKVWIFWVYDSHGCLFRKTGQVWSSYRKKSWLARLTPTGVVFLQEEELVGQVDTNRCGLPTGRRAGWPGWHQQVWSSYRKKSWLARLTPTGVVFLQEEELVGQADTNRFGLPTGRRAGWPGWHQQVWSSYRKKSWLARLTPTGVVFLQGEELVSQADTNSCGLPTGRRAGWPGCCENLCAVTGHTGRPACGHTCMELALWQFPADKVWRVKPRTTYL